MLKEPLCAVMLWRLYWTVNNKEVVLIKTFSSTMVYNIIIARLTIFLVIIGYALVTITYLDQKACNWFHFLNYNSHHSSQTFCFAHMLDICGDHCCRPEGKSGIVVMGIRCPEMLGTGLCLASTWAEGNGMSDKYSRKLIEKERMAQPWMWWIATCLSQNHDQLDAYIGYNIWWHGDAAVKLQP